MSIQCPVDIDAELGCAINDASGRFIASCPRPEDALELCRCVNALANVPDPAELRKAADALREAIGSHLCAGPYRLQSLDRLSAAIDAYDKARGKP